MLNFYRLSAVNYRLEDQDECLSEQEPDVCDPKQTYKMPIMPGDELKFIIPKYDILYSGYSVEDVRVGLSNCGIHVTEDLESNDISVIGTIEAGESETHLYVTLTVPNVPDCENYELLFYTIYDPADCSLFSGITGQEMCDEGYLGGEIIGCLGSDFCMPG
jgi:hypothetical protein